MATTVRPMLKTYAAWLERCQRNRVALAAFQCPKCNEQVQTPKPKGRGEVWDTLTACPFCNELMWKVAHADGRVEIHVIPEEAPHVS